MIILTNVASLFANLTPVAYILAIFLGLGNAIGTVIPPLLASTFFSNKDFGKAYGVMFGALQLGMTTGSLMVAYIFDLTGAYTTAWIVLLILSIVTMSTWLVAYFKGKQYKATI